MAKLSEEHCKNHVLFIIALVKGIRIPFITIQKCAGFEAVLFS